MLLVSWGCVQTVQHNPDHQDEVNTPDTLAGATSVTVQITVDTGTYVTRHQCQNTHFVSAIMCTTTPALIQN